MAKRDRRSIQDVVNDASAFARDQAEKLPPKTKPSSMANVDAIMRAWLAGYAARGEEKAR